MIPTTLLAALSLTLFHTAMFMGSIALPIVVTHNLGGTKAEVGLIFSVCAFLEVVVMSAFYFCGYAASLVRPADLSSAPVQSLWSCWLSPLQ
jgi:hypothetical protein